MMIRKKSIKQTALSVLVLFSMFAAALLNSSTILADDTPAEATPTFTPTPTLTATPTTAPTATQEVVEVQAAPAAQDEPTAEPQVLPSNTPTETVVVNGASDTEGEAEPTQETTQESAGEETTETGQDASATATTTETATATVDLLSAAAEEATATPDLTPTATEETEEEDEGEGEEVVPLLMPNDTSHVIPGEYIVIYKKNKGNSKEIKAASTKVKEKGGEIREQFQGKREGFSAKLTKDALHELRKNEDIDYIEPDQYISVADDGIVSGQTVTQEYAPWGLDRIDQTNLPLDGLFHYPTSAGSGVHIYIVDSGILTSHSDFGGRASSDLDLVNDGLSQSQYLFHGTAVAGIAGGSTYGVAKAAYLHSIRVLDDNGDGSVSDVVAGINWVISNGSYPAVINLSLGGDITSDSLDQAVADAVAAGITVVVAAGNQSSNACNYSPARAASAITVGATTQTDSLATSYSNYGSCVDIFAPGSSILTDTNTGGTVTSQGTSMAAPFVAGAAALYLADSPSAGPGTVTNVLTSQATQGVILNLDSNSPNLLLSVYSGGVAQITLNSPEDGYQTNQSSITLSWNANSIGNTYEYEVDDASDFNTPVTSSTTENLSVSLSGFTTDGTYYWRVRETNADLETGDWSETWSFIVDTVAPDAPVLSSPESGTASYGTPAFEWTASDGATYYQFEYNTVDSTDSPVYLSEELTTTSITPPDMDTDTLYYWYARAGDEAGNWSSWTSAYTVTVLPVPETPAGPILSGPLAGALLTDAVPEFTWEAVSDGVSYQIQIASNSAFSSIVQDQEEITGLTYTASTLADAAYYWRVRAKNAIDVYGSWSLVWSFTLDTTGPAAPVLLSPANGTAFTGMPEFEWSSSATAVAYQFEFSTDTDPETYEFRSEELTGTSYKPLTKTLTVDYYWFVRARDEAGNWGDWSDPFTVSVTQPTPARVSQASPANKALINDNTPELAWYAVDYAEYYNVQISTSSKFTVITRETDVVVGTSYTPDDGEELPDGKYYWRVRAKSEIGEYGDWSKSRYFTVDATAPAKPVLRSPANTAVVAGTPKFRWYKPDTAVAYQFTYNTVDDPDSALYTSDETSKYYITPPAMAAMTTYYWYARARDKAGNWSDWSDPFMVTIHPLTPGKVKQSTPAHKSLTTDNTPELAWSAVDYAEDYHIQISTNSKFTAIVQEQADYTTLTFTSAELADGKYYWRVRAQNAVDGYGKWSSSRYFTVDTTAPDAPTLLSPAYDSEIVGTPTFKWSRPSSAKYYQFAYNTEDNTETLIYTSEESKKYSITPPEMDTDTLYYWYARARDTAGNWSEWSTAFIVTVVPPTPGKASLSTPDNKTLTTDNTPELTWSAVDYAVDYHIQISTSSKFTVIAREAANIEELTYTVPLIEDMGLPDGKYYWRVQAQNELDSYGNWSSARYFTVDTTAPAAPVIRYPLTDATVVGTPTFKWYKPDTAKYYQFQYNDVDDTATFVHQSEVITKNYYKPPEIEPLTQYYWYVRAGDNAGNWSDWTAYTTVTIDPPTPSKVSLVSPQKKYVTDDYSFEVSWKAASYGYVYQIQIDNSSRFKSVDYTYDSDVDALSATVGPLEPGKWYWRVRAVNEQGETGKWSSSRYFTVYPNIDTQFESDSDFEGWESIGGAGWGVASGVMSTTGLAGDKTTSARFAEQPFSNFTYTASMMMDAPASGEYNVYGLVLRGSPVLDEWNDWSDGVYFTIKQINDAAYNVQYTCALVYRISGSTWTFQGGSCGAADYGAYNDLTVYTSGSTMKFYVNNALVLSQKIKSASSGNVGVVTWGESQAATYVNWAEAGLPEEPVAAASALNAQSALPFEVDPEEQFNEMKK